MCGIAGVINFKRPPIGDVRSMIELIKHRGPDAQCVYEGESITFGHARLRILDLNPRADQPFFNHDRSVVVVFNGEIYNYKDLKKDLPDYQFKTSCDTEVILAAYQKWGLKCPEHFVGMFSFVLYDFRKRQAFGARDRFGIKPFFYTIDDGQFAFCSEVKGLLPVVRNFQPNYDVIVDYLYERDFEKSRETFFRDVVQLLPAQYFVLNENDFHVDSYYNLECTDSRADIDQIEAASTLRALLTKSVSRRVQSDVPVGLYFSGGIDSTAIGIGIKEALPLAKMRSYTAVSEDVPQDHKNIIMEMANELNLNNRMIGSEPENPSMLLRRLMWHMEIPFTSSVICDDILNSAAKKDDVTVVIEGQGSDESQAGYVHYFVPYLIDCLAKTDLRALRDCVNNPPQPLKHKLFRSVLMRGIVEILRYSHLYDPIKRLDPPAIHELVGEELQEIYLSKEMERGPSEVSSSRLVNYQHHDMGSKLQRVLRMKDRISMSYSRELRVPFLDHELVDFMFSLPNHFKIHKGRQKDLLIRALQPELPELCYSMAKNDLLRDKLTSRARTTLRQDNISTLSSEQAEGRGLFADSVFSNLPESSRMNGGLYWRMGQVELWHQMFIDQQTTLPHPDP